MRLATPGGNVEALFLPATAVPAVAPQPVVIFAHGNGEVTDYWVGALDGFRERGIGVLLVEYPGYGRSTGAPSEASIRAADAGGLRSDFPRSSHRPRIAFSVLASPWAAARFVCWPRSARYARSFCNRRFPRSPYSQIAIGHRGFLLRDRFDNESTVERFCGSGAGHPRTSGWSHPLAGRPTVGGRAARHSTFKLYECGHGCWDPDHLPFWQDAVPFLEQSGILPECAYA